MGWWPFKRDDRGSKPEGDVPIVYRPILSYRLTEQDMYNYPWPHQTKNDWGGNVNCWSGNQLPGDTNFIPGVAQSFAPHVYNRNLQLTKNVPLNAGYNIAGMSQTAANEAVQSQGTDWHSKIVAAWQSGENHGRRS